MTASVRLRWAAVGGILTLSAATPVLASPVGPFTWQTRALVGPTVFGIEGAAGAAIGDKIYVSHGNTAGADVAQLRIYDPATDSWSFGPSASVDRSELAAVAWRGKMYSIGGRQQRFGALDAVEIHDPVAGTWVSGTPLDTARAGFCAAVVNDRIHVIGGRAGTDPLQGPVLASHEVFDGTSWGAAASLPIPVLDNYACVALEGRIYVFGGHTGVDATGATQIYDDASDTWSLGASMPTPRSNAIAGVLDCHPVVIGGVSAGTRSNVDRVEIYHPDTDTWEAGPDKPTSASEMAASMPGLADAVHAIGSGIFGMALSTHEVLVGIAAGCQADQPPTCDAGGPHAGVCGSATIDGATVTEPEGESVSYTWTSSRTDVTLAPSSGTLPGGFGPLVVPPSVATLDPTVPPCGVSDTVTLTVDDGHGNVSTCSATVTFSDTVAPSLTGVPADETVECDKVPPAATATASDNCDPSPTIAFSETRTAGGCLDRYTLTRTWTATDACGNARSATQVVTVRDTTAPALSGCPADVTVECDRVPPPAAPTASDNCDPAPVIAFAEVKTPGSCAGSYTLTRTWTATDRCGLSAACTQVVTVADTTPPVVTPDLDDRFCLWPPNHKYVCFGAEQFPIETRDDCSEPITWRFEGCASSQCDDAPCAAHPGENGDGDTTEDCVVAPDGKGFCVRSERAGTDPTGRRYGVTVVATDACGNASAPVPIGGIYVPHDQEPRLDCIHPK